MHTTSLQITTNGSKQKPRSNNQTSRSLLVYKSSGVTSNSMPVDNSRNSSSFPDSKHFVCSTCQKCVFNANHDVCLTKILKEVNSRIKVQSPKTRNNIKPVEKITNVIKPKRWISKGYRFSPNKSLVVHEKPSSLRSCLKWKPTGRIFKTAGLRWIPTRKMFTDCTTKVGSEPPNEDITNPYECDQTLNVSAGTLNLSSSTSFNPKKERLRTTLQAPFLKEKKDLVAVAAPRPVDPAGSPSSTTIDQDKPSANSSSKETTLQGVIPSNLHHLNQSFDTLTKDLKTQIQEKVFANAGLKNKLRKLKGNTVDTKFVKASIMGKPPLQPSRNHSVVRQPNAFKSERPRISKPKFASQVDVKYNLPKPVTPHYFPNFRESAPAKPHHVNAPSSSRNCQKESYGSNDMAYNHFLVKPKEKDTRHIFGIFTNTYGNAFC
ncbi:hypothetical protein Tco_0268079 [Tanacetum coccineum]